MTDCSIMIPVIIFFCRGHRYAEWEPLCVVWPEAAPGLSVLVSKEMLCSEGKTCAPWVFVGSGCVH